MKSNIKRSHQVEQLFLTSPKSQPGDLNFIGSSSSIQKTFYRQKSKRKSKNFIITPLIQKNPQINSSEFTKEMNFQSILSSNLQASQQYLKMKKLLRVTNQISIKQSGQKKNDKQSIIFAPEQKFIMLLNLATILVIYMYFCEIPISIAFENHRKQADTERIFEIINIPALIIFLGGSLIRARTAYFQYGILVTDAKLIALNYLKKSFIIDVLSIGSIIVYEISEVLHKGPIQYRFIILLFYLKIGDLTDMEKFIIQQYDLNRRVKASLKLLLLLTKIYMLCNIVACGFFYLSDNLCRQGRVLENCKQCCWTTFIKYNKKTINQCQWTVQYSYSIYWASTTMISIGYGDITPQNPYEISYTIFIQFVSCLVYAYSLNNIWEIIQQLNSKKAQIRHRISVMNTYMRDKRIGPQLKSKIKAYLLHFYHTKNVRQKDIESDIISDLTPSLKSQLFYQSYGFIFKGHNFFKNFSSFCLQNSSQKIIQSGYFEDQMIFSPLQEEGQNMLFYIQQGQVQNYIQLFKNKISVRKIFLDQTIGLCQFITQLNYKTNLVANKYSVVYKLKFEDWKYSLMEQDQDFQTFFMIKQNIIFQKNYQQIDLRCQFCRQKTHSSQQCFETQLNNFMNKFIKRYKATSERRTFKRQNKKSSHISSRISIMKGNISAFQNSIIENSKLFKHQTPKRKVSFDLFTNKIQKNVSQHNKRKKIAMRNNKFHHDLVREMKSRIQKQMQGQQFDDLYSQDSQMLSTDNIIDKVQNYDWFFAMYNADQQMKNINHHKKLTLNRIL